MEPIILASTSPRRQEILKFLNIPFQVNAPQYDEKTPENIEIEKIAEYHATKKVEAVAKSYPKNMELPFILGADTTVIYNGKIFRKPVDAEEAFSFLKELSGKTHKVITAITMFNPKINYLSSKSVEASVTFANMSDEEINWYIDQGEWHGAAGGYRIQGLASIFITKIEGTNSGVVGLPINTLYDILKEQGYSILN